MATRDCPLETSQIITLTDVGSKRHKSNSNGRAPAANAIRGDILYWGPRRFFFMFHEIKSTNYTLQRIKMLLLLLLLGRYQFSVSEGGSDLLVPSIRFYCMPSLSPPRTHLVRHDILTMSPDQIAATRILLLLLLCSWLASGDWRHYATRWEVPGSIPGSDLGNFQVFCSVRIQ
jgi:hypothetical protein